MGSNHKKRIPDLCLLCAITMLNICIQSEFAIASFTNDTDRLALLSFKEKISIDPSGTLSSWNDSLNFCQWDGVTCSKRRERVTSLNLEAKGLVGTLSSSVGNLTFLRVINLGSNYFRGEIPPEIGNLFRLQVLNLSLNSVGGEIPVNLSRCQNLKLLNLKKNGLTGRIPSELSFNTNLQILLVASNNLTGRIPPSLGNLSSLAFLVLMINNLDGSIPHELGQLKRLKSFQLAGNKLTGTLPPTIYNLTSVIQLSVAGNALAGSLLLSVGLGFPNMQWLSVGDNYLTGSIPDSILNATNLLVLDVSHNEFIGTVPESIGSLQGFQHLNVGSNRLGTGKANDLSFLTSLTNCTNLQVLGLDDNDFGGVLPSSIANLSTQLITLTLGRNQIQGSIPLGIENLVNLGTLGFEENALCGSIPDGIGKLSRLQLLVLSKNMISGNIPSSIGNMTIMIKLYLDNNALEGSIPTTLGNCQYLQVLHLTQNNLNGAIPKQILSLSGLSISLSLGHNSLSGSLPLEIGNLKSLVELDISGNNFSGEIPEALGDCLTLEQLYMDHNSFETNIPQALSNLASLKVLDLSHNNLTGKIPTYFEKLHLLWYLNLSFNNLDGEVPNEGFFSNLSAASIMGNSKLCGGTPALSLPACPVQPRKKHDIRSIVSKVIAPVIGVTCSILIMAIFIVGYFVRSRNKVSYTSSKDNQVSRLPYMQLFEATGGFSSDNLVGRGSHGSVYRGILNKNGKEVAVKVFNLSNRGSLKSFVAEYEALKNIRHRNLVKIISCWSGVDFKGDNFKALVFEFMPNGSLENWLHPTEEQQNSKRLSFLQRLNAAIHIASALEYLHFYCQQPIIHCDIKPSNILFDSEMTAHVGDFGLARLLNKTTTNLTQNNTSSSIIKGTIGYVAPEYAMGAELSTYSDLYSYGILLLEMFTAKRPTDAIFEIGLNLHEFAKIGLAEQPLRILDPALLQEGEEYQEDETKDLIPGNSQRTVRNKWEECLVLVIKIGLICSTESPKNRPDMREVSREMQAIKDYFLGSHNLRYVC